MKLTPAKALRSCAMLCSLLCLYYSVSAAQPEYKITLKAHQTELKSILRSIEDQTGLYFMFNTNMIQLQEKVSIHVQSIKLEDVLQQLFAARSISWSIIRRAIVLKHAAAPPVSGKEPVMRAISGLVSDENGAPLPGATLMIKGTNIGTLSSVNGTFILPGVPTNASVLVARFTGFKPMEIPIGTDNNIRVVLKRSVSNLDETVVVAYGTATERSTTGAISVVKGEQIQTLPNRSFDKSLQGLVPGLRISNGTGQPGGGISNMILRGISTGTEAQGGSTVRNPLIVIDGVPVAQDGFIPMESGAFETPLSNALSQFNPDDISEISVLKDAAAIALYGSKASNGVILVSTKKGNVGKTSFNFNHQTDFSFLPPSKIKKMNQEQYLELLYETYRQTNPAYTDDSIRAELFTKFPYRVNGQDTSFYKAPDWEKLVYRSPAIALSNNLSISGGTPVQRYYINVGHTSQHGIVRGTDFNRTSLRVNVDNKPAHWLKLGVNTMLSYTTQSVSDNFELSNSGTGLADVLSPLIPNRFNDGSYNMLFGWGATTSGARIARNPVAAAEFNYNKNKAFHALASLSGEITFLRHFSISSLLGIDYMHTENRQKSSPVFRGDDGYGFLQNYDLRRSDIISTNSLGFKKQLGKYHQLHVLLSQEARIQEQNNSMLKAEATNQFTNPYLNDISSPGYNRPVAYGMSNRATMLSQFSQLNYNFKEKYYLQGSWRRDGASVFGSNNPWANYWSLGGAWIASSERFMYALQPVINFLKFRGSIGIAGNTATLDPYMAYQQLKILSYLGRTALVASEEPGNPSIEWEKTRQWNLGMQVGLLNNRIYMDADYYYKFTKNLIFPLPLQSYTGFPAVRDNVGDMRNSGLELSLRAELLQKTQVKWSLSANWSRNSNKLIRSNGQHIFRLSNPLMAAEVGREFNSYYLPVWAGANPENGMPQWMDKDGKPTSDYANAEKEFLGQSQPKGYGAVTNSVSWKGWNCLLQFQYQYGGMVFNQQYVFYFSDGQNAYANAPAEVINRWRKPGDISDNPVRVLNNYQSGPYYPSSRFMYKSDYLRLQLVTLSWNFPRHILKPVHIESLRVFAQGNNLALWKPAKGIDPDLINPGGAAGFAYPNPRTWSIGLYTSF